MYRLTNTIHLLARLMLGMILVLLFVSISPISSASEIEKFSMGGFISQGVVHTSDNQFFDKKDDTSFNMTEASLQANYQLSSNIQISGQVMYRNWGKIENSTLDYLMVDYRFLASDTSNMGIRLGRIKNDFGLYNLTRDIPSARPSIFLPQSIYLDILRDTITSADGISLYANHRFSAGNLSWSAMYGRFNVTDDLIESMLGTSIKGKFSVQEYTRYFKFTWEPIQGDWLISFGYNDPVSNFEPQLSPSDKFAISKGKFKYESFLLSYQYFAENWDFSIEYERKITDATGFDFYIPNVPEELQPEFPPLFKLHNVKDAFYGQWRYLLSDKLTFLLRYSEFVADNDDKNGKKFAVSSIAKMPAFSRYSHTITTGVNWQITDHWRIDFEGHYFEGIGVISPLVKVDSSQNTSKYWQLFAIQASYSF